MNARRGTFLATPIEWAVNNSTNGLPQFVCRFSLDAEYGKEENGEAGFFDCSGEGMEITAYLNLVTSAKAVNRFNVDSIEKAFGWTDRKIDTLNNGDWSATQVQLVLEDKTYEGKTRLTVKYLNPRDYAGGNGGVEKADANALQQMQVAFGAILSAGAPAQARRPVTNPANGTAPATANPLEQAKCEAWEKYKGLPSNKGKSAQVLADPWKAAIAAYFDGRDQKSLGRAEWKQFADNDFKKPESPVDTAQQFKEDDIPF